MHTLQELYNKRAALVQQSDEAYAADDIEKWKMLQNDLERLKSEISERIYIVNTKGKQLELFTCRKQLTY